jgi:putative transposase
MGDFLILFVSFDRHRSPTGQAGRTPLRHVQKPATLLHFHSVQKTRKYRMLFSRQRGRRPGPKGPKKDLIDAVVAMKRLTFIGHMKDSLWSCDLFRCESATLRTHWVLVVMDQFTRRVIWFGVHGGIVDGVTLCGMFQRAIRG